VVEILKELEVGRASGQEDRENVEQQRQRFLTIKMTAYHRQVRRRSAKTYLGLVLASSHKAAGNILGRVESRSGNRLLGGVDEVLPVLDEGVDKLRLLVQQVRVLLH